MSAGNYEQGACQKKRNHKYFDRWKKYNNFKRIKKSEAKGRLWPADYHDRAAGVVKLLAIELPIPKPDPSSAASSSRLEAPNTIVQG
jgi:hypothetical protein